MVIDVMKKGKLRGQAFISFDSLDDAQEALHSLHGYILKAKPLIITFARS